MKNQNDKNKQNIKPFNSTFILENLKTIHDHKKYEFIQKPSKKCAHTTYGAQQKKIPVQQTSEPCNFENNAVILHTSKAIKKQYHAIHKQQACRNKKAWQFVIVGPDPAKEPPQDKCDQQNSAQTANNG